MGSAVLAQARRPHSILADLEKKPPSPKDLSEASQLLSGECNQGSPKTCPGKADTQDISLLLFLSPRQTSLWTAMLLSAQRQSLNSHYKVSGRPYHVLRSGAQGKIYLPSQLWLNH